MAALNFVGNRTREAILMPYKRAPVTEAVIELRFAEPIDQETVKEAARRGRKGVANSGCESSPQPSCFHNRRYRVLPLILALRHRRGVLNQCSDVHNGG